MKGMSPRARKEKSGLRFDPGAIDPRQGTSAFRKEMAFQHEAKRVIDGQVEFLNLVGDGGGDADGMAGVAGESPTAGAGEADGDEAKGIGGLDGEIDAPGVPGSGDPDKDITGPAERIDKLGKSKLGGDIVGEGGEEGGEVGEGKAGKALLEMGGEAFAQALPVLRGWCAAGCKPLEQLA